MIKKKHVFFLKTYRRKSIVSAIRNTLKLYYTRSTCYSTGHQKYVCLSRTISSLQPVSLNVPQRRIINLIFLHKWPAWYFKQPHFNVIFCWQIKTLQLGGECFSFLVSNWTMKLSLIGWAGESRLSLNPHKTKLLLSITIEAVTQLKHSQD